MRWFTLMAAVILGAGCAGARPVPAALDDVLFTLSFDETNGCVVLARARDQNCDAAELPKHTQKEHCTKVKRKRGTSTRATTVSFDATASGEAFRVYFAPFDVAPLEVKPGAPVAFAVSELLTSAAVSTPYKFAVTLPGKTGKDGQVCREDPTIIIMP